MCINLKSADMINLQNVVQLLAKYVLKLPPSIVRSSDPSVSDEHVAKQLYENLLSILNCTEYSFEAQDTLDYSYDIDRLVEVDEMNQMKKMLKIPLIKKRKMETAYSVKFPWSSWRNASSIMMKSILERVKRSTAGVCFSISLNRSNPKLISNASAGISLVAEQKDKNLKKSIASPSVVLKKR